jgi:hypothetical protein
MQTANYQARDISAVASGLHLAATPAAASTQWPRITLITPVYNGARFIEETIRSINASDLLHTNGLFVVGSVFASLPAVEWLTGRPTRFNPNGMTVDIRNLPSWSRYRFLAGANKYIQQESTFWRRSLWQKAGGELNATYRDVGDFDLWVRFFRHARLYSVDASLEGTVSIPMQSAPRT